MIAILLAALLAMAPVPAAPGNAPGNVSGIAPRIGPGTAGTISATPRQAATLPGSGPAAEDPLEGEATWYCLAGVSRCTTGFAEGGLFAAVSEDFGIEPGSRVEVCSGEACVIVRVIDTCSGCDRIVDLYAAAFARLAPLGTGRVPVRLRVLRSGVFASIAVAVGHRSRGTGEYTSGATVVVAPRTYVTIRADVGPELAGFPVEFWQRNGRDGSWVRRTIGRVAPDGFVYWSTLPPHLPGTGYSRYVYYRTRFDDTFTIPASWSPGLGRVVVRPN
jgi:hypothetical protein